MLQDRNTWLPPSPVGRAGSPTSKNSWWVTLQEFPGLQETNKQSARVFVGRITTTDTNTKNDGDDDGEGDDGDGDHILTTRAKLMLRALHTLNCSLQQPCKAASPITPFLQLTSSEVTASEAPLHS